MENALYAFYSYFEAPIDDNDPDYKDIVNKYTYEQYLEDNHSDE